MSRFKDTELDRAKWSEDEFVNFLDGAVQEFAASEDEDAITRTFESAGLLTMNKGLVVKIRGCEFQVTVVRSH